MQLGKGPKNSKVMYVGEAWGRDEAVAKEGFVGDSGKHLRVFARRAGIPLESSYVTNCLNFRPKNNSIKPHIDPSRQFFSPEAIEEVDRLREEILEVNPNIIIAVGGISAYVLTGILLQRENGLKHPITSTRGSIYPCSLTEGQHEVITTIHPSVYNRGDYRAGHYITLDLAKARTRAEDSGYNPLPRNYILGPTLEETLSYLSECKTKAHSFDLELRGNQVDCISFSYDSSHAISIPFVRDNFHYWPLEEEVKIWKLITEVLENPEVESIAHNASFDASFLFKVYGIRVENLADTMLMTLLHYPDFNIGLDFITSLYSDIPYYKDDGKYRTKNFDKVLVEETTFDRQFWLYNARDSIVLMDCYPSLKKDLKRQGNWETFQRVKKLYPIMTWITEKGIRIDERGLRKLSLSSDRELFDLTMEIRSETEIPHLNVSSSSQLAEYFYGKKSEGGLGIKPYTKKNSKGEQRPTVDKKAMLRLAIRGYDVAKKIVKYSSLETIKSTFFDMLLEDGRLKCSMFFTRTGRFRTWKTVFGAGANMQNQPYVMKKYMLPDPGYLIINGDLAQAENRIVAYISEDPNMMHAFNEGLDVHSYTASFILDKDISEISREPGSHPLLPKEENKTERYLGKQANHALNYGMGVDTASLQWMMEHKYVRKVVSKYHRAYRNIKRWQEQIVRQLNKTKTLTNLWGRKYTFWSRWGASLFLDANAYIPQSTVADQINERGLLFLWNRQDLFSTFEILNQVHDSIMFQAPIGDWETLSKGLIALKESLETPLTTATGITFSIPFDMEMAWPNAGTSLDLEDLSPEGLEKSFSKLNEEHYA